MLKLRVWARLLENESADKYTHYLAWAFYGILKLPVAPFWVNRLIKFARKHHPDKWISHSKPQYCHG